MLIVRPIRKDDYQVLLTIAEESGHGFTSLAGATMNCWPTKSPAQKLL